MPNSPLIRYIPPRKSHSSTVSEKKGFDLFHVHPGALRYASLLPLATGPERNQLIDTQPLLFVSTVQRDENPRQLLKSNASFFAKPSSTTELPSVFVERENRGRQISIDSLQMDAERPRMYSYSSCVETEGTSCTEVRTPEQHRLYYPSFSIAQSEHLLSTYRSLAEKFGYSYQEDKGFSWFKSCRQEKVGGVLLEKGVKFHVSLSHDTRLYEKGTLIVAQALLAANHSYYKIVQPSLLSSDRYLEAGREITIYTCMEKEPPIEGDNFSLHWSVLLRSIVAKLNDAGIEPYIDASQRIIPPKKDTIILGLQSFITWRNDKRGYLLDDAPKHPITPLHPKDPSCPSFHRSSFGL